ncbi:winged helix-turn-helix domain-containing protein [Methanococcoides orientis]|nr:winged helix-turn-helix domain-containing protein [Methanococcoides orientis]
MRKTIEALPPSAKLVYKVLEYGGLLTQKEIAEQSYLPPRTIRYALGRLKDENFLQERFYFKDARQSLYGLKEMTNQQAAGETVSQAEFDFANVYTVPKEYEVLAT